MADTRDDGQDDVDGAGGHTDGTQPSFDPLGFSEKLKGGKEDREDPVVVEGGEVWEGEGEVVEEDGGEEEVDEVLSVESGEVGEAFVGEVEGENKS